MKEAELVEICSCVYVISDSYPLLLWQGNICAMSLTFYRILIRGARSMQNMEKRSRVGQMNEGNTCQHQNQIPMQRQPDEKKGRDKISRRSISTGECSLMSTNFRQIGRCLQIYGIMHNTTTRRQIAHTHQMRLQHEGRGEVLVLHLIPPAASLVMSSRAWRHQQC